jgi:hypothetical protein
MKLNIINCWKHEFEWEWWLPFVRKSEMDGKSLWYAHWLGFVIYIRGALKFHVMNGWVEAPHCWRHYWKFSFDRTPAWNVVGAFGFAVFWWWA